MNYNKGIKKKLLKILKEKSIIKKKVVLSGGKKSSYYIDGRMTSLDRDGVVLCARLFAGCLSGIDCVGGPTLGADPFLGAVLYECRLKKKRISGFIVRKKPKSHGMQKSVEGPVYKGARAAVLEDVITSGRSVYKAAKILEDCGIRVVRILALVDREEGGVEFLKEKGYTIYPIFKKSELGL